VEDYLEKNNVPQNALHKKVCKHRLCTCTEPLQQMKTSEPDDGGGISHKECGLHQVILNYKYKL
jgi:phosphoadenosine phosphosulfate reductase